MKLEVSRMDMWVGRLRDVPGALSKKLGKLAEAGADLTFVIARRVDKKKGSGVMFLSPVVGAAQARVAKKAGIRKSKSLVALRVVGPNKAGLGACVTCALAGAGINLRGLSAAVIGKKFVMHVALDSKADATLAARVLRKL